MRWNFFDIKRDEIPGERKNDIWHLALSGPSRYRPDITFTVEDQKMAQAGRRREVKPGGEYDEDCEASYDPGGKEE